MADAAGNAGLGTIVSNNYAIDTLRPDANIVVADSALQAGETSLVTFKFSEAVTGFTNAALTIDNGTLSAVTSGDGGLTWTATFTPTADLEDTSNVITLDDTGVTDLAGNTGVGTSVSNNYAIDTLHPSVTVNIVDPSLSDVDNISLVTFEFSENVTGFDIGDLTPVGGTLSGFTTVDGNSYNVLFTANDGISTIGSVTVGTGYTDTAGNTGTGNSDTVTIDTATAPIITAPDMLYLAQVPSGDATPINRISFQNADRSGSVRVTLSMDQADDVLTAATTAAVTVGGSGTPTITLDGSIADINAFLFAGSVQWNPNGATDADAASGTLTVTIDDNGTADGGNTVSTTVAISELVPETTSPMTNDYSGVNIVGSGDFTPSSGGNGGDTITTSWSNQSTTAITYDGAGGNNDTINLVFTPDQLAAILADTTARTSLTTYLADATPSGLTLDLSATSWNAIVTGYEFASVSLATGYGVGTFALSSAIIIPPPAASSPDAGDNTVPGTAGADNLTDGSGGDDILVGLAGNDTLTASSGTDLLLAGDGDDTLTGGAGADVLSGGRGADIFVSNAGDSGANADTILDYSFVEGDKLDFRDLLTAPFNTGDLVSDFVHFTVSGSDIVVEVDVDGAAGGANFVTAATLKNYGASNQNLVDVVLDNTLSATTVAITSVTDDVGPITGALTSGGVTDDTVLALAGSITGTLLADEVVAVYDGATRLGTATVGGGGTSWTYTDNTLTNGNVVIYTARVEDAVGTTRYCVCGLCNHHRHGCSVGDGGHRRHLAQ